jgi:NitT/TauT family transport system permease protein
MRRVLFILGVFVAMVGLWELLVWVFKVHVLILPPPSKVATALCQGFTIDIHDWSFYPTHIVHTFVEGIIGFLVGGLLGLLIGALLSEFPLFLRVLYPYIFAFQALPKIALAPLLVIWLGIGFSSRLALVVVVTFFPVLVNSISGLNSTKSERIELMRSLSATRWQTFRMVKFPSALPFIFVGLRLSGLLSLVAAVVAEFVGGSKGLGTLLLYMSLTMETAGVLSIVVILALLSIVLYMLITYATRRLVFWSGK